MSFQDLIPVVNKLQDIATSTQVAELDLPVLAVVGSQSCGKSSVLENIVGRDFLPRGTGIVTRRPLVLQLINTPPGAPYGEFLHAPGQRFFSFSDIRHEIDTETARVAGANKGISRIPINLKIYSPDVTNLTLVDLPGLTKIPIGDQPTDIEKQTRSLILEYIAKPNSIILAVSPANVDLVNSESLKLARQVDPTGRRTVGILTKLDLMDEGTNALEILQGSVYPLKLGFVGIVNRSQQDISSHKSLEDSLSAEEAFFKNHLVYRTIASKCGTRYLTATLHRILMSHIRDKLPDIKARLNTLMGQAEQELAAYGGDVVITDDTKGVAILNLMTRFAQNFVNSIDGTNINDISTKELCGGARLYHIYNEVYGNQLASINPTHNLSVHDIRIAIRNSTGSRPSLFVPELAFDLLVKPQIKLLEEPSKKCVELVYEELMKIVHSICSTGIEFGRYPRLQMKLIEVVSDLLRQRLGPTIKYVESIIEINRSYINTNHPNFVGAAQAMTSVVEERRKHQHPPVADQSPVTSESDLDDVNTIDEDLPKARPKEPVAAGTPTHKSSESVSSSSESYLNYFFGKDPITHQQYLATQAQLNPTPFKFPLSHDNLPLQFNSSSSSSTVIDMRNLNLNESFDADDAINELTEKEQLECELIRRLIVSYFGIIRETVKDQVPKSIMTLLVNYIKDNIQNQLVFKLYHDDLFDELLTEDESLQAERDKCHNLLQTYREAAKVINEVV